MRTTITIILLALAFASSHPAYADRCTRDEALNVARNWITLTIARQGSWGDLPTASVTGIQEMTRGRRVLGYYCPVRPAGFIVVSAWKELGAVKAFSTTSSFDPASDVGPADLIKGGMERNIRAVEARIGDIGRAPRDRLDSVLEFNYRDAWTDLALPPAEFKTRSENLEPNAVYEEYDILLSSLWNQGDPYNQDCPAGDTCAHCVVGCVATAGAQVMRYWCWPPYGVGAPYNDTYDWVNMPDQATGGSTAAEKAAVAELSREIGIAVGMKYTCDLSEAYTEDMVGVYENQYRYSTACYKADRSASSASEWFDAIKAQISSNQPIQYRIPGHSTVCDGWFDVETPTLQRYYHHNYGWADTSFTTWYLLDNLHMGNPDEEYMLLNIRPKVAVGAAPSGTYPREMFPYRYFNFDAVCSADATFASGQFLQSLPNIVVSANVSNALRIYGTPMYTTCIFTRGDTSKGIRIDDGGLKATYGGGFVLH